LKIQDREHRDRNTEGHREKKNASRMLALQNKKSPDKVGAQFYMEVTLPERYLPCQAENEPGAALPTGLG
jgi:hypothetical protein